MTTTRLIARVGADGNVVVPVGTDGAGKAVGVTVVPADGPRSINGLSHDEWFAILDRRAGSIPDIERPAQGVAERRPPLE